MVQASSLTLADFLNLPETKPASEYIDGKVIQKPMPQGKHSQLQGELVTAINRALKPDRIACAFPELRCTFGDRSLIPDISVFTWSRIPLDTNSEIANVFSLAPDWAIEILSPDQSQTKVTKKLLYCLGHGTELGWLVDPEEKTVLVYRPRQEIMVCDRNDALLLMPGFADKIDLTVGELFGWLRL